MSKNIDEIDLSEMKDKDKLLMVRQITRSLELRYRGYVWDSKGEKFIHKNNALLGEDLIQNAISLLDPFSHAFNLISKKKKFPRQQLTICRTFLKSLVKNNEAPLENMDTVFEMFHQTIINIGDVICNSRSYMELTNSYNEDKKEEKMSF